MRRSMLCATLVLVAIRCAAPASHGPEETVIVIPLAASATDRELAQTEFDRWITANVRTPNSVFRLVQLGRTRNEGHARFVVAIPSSWGPNAVGNRTVFVRRQRDLVRSAMRESTRMVVPGPTAAASGVPRIIIVPPLDSRGMQRVWNPGAPAHAANVCDLSPSASAGVVCTADSLAHSFDRWLPHGVAVGSTFRVWIVGTSISTATVAFTIQTPELPLADRVLYLLSARNELAQMFAHPREHVGSAVIEAIAVAAADLTTRAGSRELCVLSDLRQTSGPWSFERDIPAPREFSRWLAAERLLPDCREIAVTVCGVHFGATPREPAFDGRRGAELRAAWTAAFAAMHTKTIEICSGCDAEAFMDRR